MLRIALEELSGGWVDGLYGHGGNVVAGEAAGGMAGNFQAPSIGLAVVSPMSPDLG
jgi:hypothetical protein